MGRKRSRNHGRNVSGVLLLDKPLGITSNAALQEVKKMFFASKAGHTGSLDPLATGLLVICFGEATKIANYVIEADKYYFSKGQLGVNTTTADMEGEATETRPVPKLDRAQVEDVLKSFTGDIMQVPPMYSALKHNGEPLYKLARQGIEVEREPRPVSVYSLDLVDLTDDTFSINVRCSRGTYIRTLVEDIGNALGCGAHVTELRRTELGPFSEASMVTMETLQQTFDTDKRTMDQHLIAIDSALEHWPAVNLSADMAFYVRQGQPVVVSKAPTDGLVRLFEGEDTFIGVGHILDDGRVAPKRLLNL